MTTGNLTIISPKLTIDNFQEIVLENNGHFFNDGSLSGGIDSGNGNIFFYGAMNDIINEHSVGIEISSRPNDSDKIMCNLIYDIYKKLKDVSIRGHFVLVFDNYNFIRNSHKIIKLEDDYKKYLSIKCYSETVRNEVKKMILDSEITIENLEESNLPTLKTAYFFVENNEEKNYFSISFKTEIIDIQVVSLLLEICKKYEVQLVFLDDFELSGVELERFENQIVKFY